MVLVVTLLPGVHWRELSELSGSGALLAAVLFVVLSATAGWVIGGPQAGPRRILALCCGQPNMAAAFVIANQNFSDPRVILMLLVVLIASLLILLPLTFFFARRPLAPLREDRPAAAPPTRSPRPRHWPAALRTTPALQASTAAIQLDARCSRPLSDGNPSIGA